MYEWKRFALLLIAGRRGPAVSQSRYGVGSGPVHTIARRSYPNSTAWAYRRISIRGLAAAPFSYRVKGAVIKYQAGAHDSFDTVRPPIILC